MKPLYSIFLIPLKLNFLTPELRATLNNMPPVPKSIVEYIYKRHKLVDSTGREVPLMAKYPDTVRRVPVGEPIGVLAAVHTVGDTVYIGWSKCNHGAGDGFDKVRGVDIAIQRSVKASKEPVPMSIVPQYTRFIGRAARYFKDKDVTTSAINMR